MEHLYPIGLANPRATHLKQSFKNILLAFSLVLVSQLAFAGGTPSLDFRGAILESGGAGKDDAVYRFSKVDKGIDALVRIKERSDSLVYLANIDISTSGFDKAFQPVVGYNKGTAPGAVDWWMDFEISFVASNTSMPVIVNAFDVSGIDIDGNGDKIREYMSLYGLNSYVLESNSLLNVSSVSQLINGIATKGKRFDGPALNYVNIDTSGTAVMVTASYVKTNTFTVRMGGVSLAANGAAERMNSLYFKDFTFNTPQTVLLPVRLESFTVYLESKQPVLNWIAKTEEYLSYYLVERSRDGKKFSSITMIMAAGNSMGAINYAFTDLKASDLSGMVYYRLKMADMDGNFKYSAIRMANLNTADDGRPGGINAFPNPVAGELRITIPSTWQNKTVAYDLFTQTGHLVKHFARTHSSQTETVQMGGMQSGTYVVRLTAGPESATRQVVKL